MDVCSPGSCPCLSPPNRPEMEVQVSAPSFSCTPQQSGWAWCHSKGDIPEGPASGRTCSGLASGVGPEVSCEPEGLVDGQVGLDNEHGVPGFWASSNIRPLLDILADETSLVELNQAIKARSRSHLFQPCSF